MDKTTMADHDNLIKVQNFIAGEFTESADYLQSLDPSRAEAWALIPDSDENDLNAAVRAAKEAFDSWSKTTVEERSKYLLKIADLLESRLDEFAEAESRDQGKPVSLARTFDIPRAILNFRCFANGIHHQMEKSTYLDKFLALNYTTNMPVGVVGLISPWNLPLYLLTFKLTPAIVCGNTVVCKPSELTSVTAWMLCKLLKEAGLPSGVVNMVFGTGPKVGDALVRHPDVKLISFTGSTATAQKIRLAAATMCKRFSLELGGKNAAIIFDDANLEKCIPVVTRSSFVNQGEVCLCTSRIFVQRGIFDKFLEMFVNSARNIQCGDPRRNDTWMGALISRDHLAKVTGYINLAKEEGATIVTGLEADRLDLDADIAKGYFLPPTVITDVSDNSRLMQEEIFGPVVCVVPFSTEKEVAERVNNVQYGLCASIWSQNVNIIHRMARQLQVATVWANCWLVRDLCMPFGGMKDSGIGREGLQESLNFFTESKTICVQLEQL